MSSHLLPDLRFVVRSALRQPVFTAVVILTLALGIGANTAMFATIHAALLKPLPFNDPGRLVFASCTFGGEPNPMASAPDYYDYREQADRFEALSAVTSFAPKTTVTGSGQPERVAFTFVADDLFRTLGVAPAAGRWFTAEEGKAGAVAVVMVSERFARRRFGGAREAVGNHLAADGRSLTIVGVMPATFRIVHDVDLWVPMRRGEAVAAAPRRFHNWLIIGRLKPGVSVESAQRQVDVISRRLQQQYPDSNTNKALRLDPLQAALVQAQTPSLLVLMAAVGLVLLIACGNVAGLLLARGSARRSELAVRAALGASRSTLVGQLLTESVTLAFVSGIVGIALALWLQPLLPIVTGLSEQGVAPGGLEWPALLFALALSIATGLLFGVAPALRASALSLTEDLAPGARTTGARGGTRLRSALVVGQVAVSLVLLIGAGLLVRSFARLTATNPGFDAEHLLVGEIQLLDTQYPEREKRILFFDGLREDLAAVPGVKGVGFINRLPIWGRLGNIPAWAADRPPATPAETRLAHARIVLPGYFNALRVPLLAGRDIATTDRENTPPALVINELMARTLFPDRSALGQRVMVDMGAAKPVPFGVVGVVGNARIDAIGQPPPMTMYASYYQFPDDTLHFALRTAEEPGSVVGVVRKLVSARDRDIPVENLVSMEQLIGESVAPQRVTAITLTLFSSVALLLASIGLYGVLAYYVSQRTHEIGVRISLGADTRTIMTHILGRAGVLVIVGLGLGLAASLAGARLIEQLLYEVTPTDPTTFVTVSACLAAVALVASAVPAWKAARIDPVRALRNE